MSDTHDSDVVSTQPTPPNEARQVAKINAFMNDNDLWEADIEYRDKDGNKIGGESRTFENFSQLTAWVAGTEVEVQQAAKEAGEEPEPEAVTNANPKDAETQTKASTAVDNQAKIEGNEDNATSRKS